MWLLKVFIIGALFSLAASGEIPLTSNALLPPVDVATQREHGTSLPESRWMTPATGFWDDDLASSADFSKFADKGGALICALAGTDRTAGHLLGDKRDPPSAASIWTDNLKQALHDWYWRPMTPATEGCNLNDYWKLSAALRALGLDARPKSQGGNNMCHRLEHWDAEKEENGKPVPAINQWYEVGGVSYRVSSAWRTTELRHWLGAKQLSVYKSTLRVHYQHQRRR